MRYRIHPCGLAIALDGTIVLNVAHLYVDPNPAAILRRALAERGSLFIGIQLPERDAREAFRWLENGAAEAAGHIGGLRQRRRRASRRIKRRTES